MVRTWLQKLLGSKPSRPPARVSGAALLQSAPPEERPGDRSIALGNQALDVGDLDMAARCYQEALAANPESAAARVNLAYVLIDTGDPDQAERHLAEAVALDGMNFDAFYMLGKIARTRRDVRAAARHFETAIELKPDFELARRDACQALLEAGAIERATLPSM